METVEASFKTQLPVFIRCILIIVGIYALSRVVRVFLKKKMLKNDRAKTIMSLADGFIKYGAAIAIIIL